MESGKFELTVKWTLLMSLEMKALYRKTSRSHIISYVVLTEITADASVSSKVDQPPLKSKKKKKMLWDFQNVET